MRALATVDTVTSISPIPGADRIVVAHVRGWNAVVKKDEFQPGDVCVYFEIDAFLPLSDPRYSFLAPRGVRTLHTGQEGYALRTAKLRGVISQGLALPIGLFPELVNIPPGTDVTNILNILKWEPPIPASLAGVSAGAWPSWLSKTDEERIQNTPGLFHYAATRPDGASWECYEKIDGASMSVFYHDGEFGVGSRTINLLEKKDNSLWRLARELGLENILTTMGVDALQGEIYGEGIQGNPLRVRGQHYAVFDVWADRTRLPRAEWPEMFHTMSVPRREDFEDLKRYPTAESLIAAVDGMRSVITPDRLAEGVVYRHPALATVVNPLTGFQEKASFKTISNKYLLKNEQ